MINQLEKTIKTILAEDAFEHGVMQVSNRVCGLIKSVDYLTEQIQYLGRFVDDDYKTEFNESVKTIIDITNKILIDECFKK